MNVSCKPIPSEKDSNVPRHRYVPKPGWLKKSLPRGGAYQKMTRRLSEAKLHTVCQEASCPNMFECFTKQTATFMIMGRECTRNCRFCNVKSNRVLPLDPEEPERLAQTVMALGLTYVVVTSVTRDDLDDGGAGHFARTIEAVREMGSTRGGDPIRVEVLIPDFKGDAKALKTVLDAGPDVLNHNLETVASLYDKARPEAVYQRSLDLIQRAKALAPSIPAKSGIMVGLGETCDELVHTLQDLHDHGCDILTMGQYLQPSKAHLDVKAYYTPRQFEDLETLARQMGFKQVASGPFVRSSYRAKELFEGVLFFGKDPLPGL